MRASMKGSVGIVRIILEHGDDMDAKTNVKNLMMMMMITIIIIVTVVVIMIVIVNEYRDYSR